MNKTVLITGTSSGLGKWTAKYFAEKGWNVIATMRNPDKHTELKYLRNIKVLALDVTQRDSIERALKEGEGFYTELKPLNIGLHLVEPGGFSSDFGENTTFVEDDPTGAYGAIARKVGERMKASQRPGALPDPGPIVKVIYDLATGKRNAFRTAVGKDARQLLFLRRLLPVRTFLNVLTRRFT
jgi:hypothetical protein